MGFLYALLACGSEAYAENRNGGPTSTAASRRGLPSNAELARMRAEVIEKMKESRAAMEKLSPFTRRIR